MTPAFRNLTMRLIHEPHDIVSTAAQSEPAGTIEEALLVDFVQHIRQEVHNSHCLPLAFGIYVRRTDLGMYFDLQAQRAFPPNLLRKSLCPHHRCRPIFRVSGAREHPTDWRHLPY